MKTLLKSKNKQNKIFLDNYSILYKIPNMMNKKEKELGMLMETYIQIKERIEQRFREFDAIRTEADNMVMLKELAFCLLTPQSKARSCAEAVERLFKNNAVLSADESTIANLIHPIRFKNNKAHYIKEAVKRFSGTDIKSHILSFTDMFETRNWFAENIKGMGMKEASHFLRNTGFGYELAILDRHILKNLSRFGVIEMPRTLTRKLYLAIENKMRYFANEINIPMHHLDFLFWYMQTGDIFK